MAIAPAATLPREQMLTAADRTPLFVRDWLLPEGTESHGNIMLMHGLGEHCDRYARVAGFFNACGYAVRTYDHRGHGRSGGRRGDVPDSEAILRDAKIVLEDFVQQAAAAGDTRLPLLLGHSMGGLFAARFAAARLSPLRGLILSSPALALPLSRGQKMLLSILGAVAPGLVVSNGLQTGFLSHDPAVEQAYMTDGVTHGKISARLLRSMLDAIEFVHTHAVGLSVPTLMVVAGDDRLVDAGGSLAFFPKLADGLGTLHVYDGFYHEIFNEVDAERVFDDVRAWLQQQDS
jgi:alpha-beta hydrolase superfamily lysophospholipase